MKTKFFITVAFVAGLMVCACGGKKETTEVETPETEADVNAFSAEALPEIVEYQRQKSSSEGAGEYNPWEMYGLKEMVSAEDVSDADYEYDDVEEEAEMEEEEQFEDASDDYEAEPVVYYLGHNVEFKLAKKDLSDFKKKGDDAVAVIDRMDNNAKQIDILIFNKTTYDDFLKKSDDLVKQNNDGEHPSGYEKQGNNVYISKGDSTASDVAIMFAGPANGGYLLSIYNK